MAIRMRNNKDQNSRCCECGDHRSDVLDMFDLCIGGTILTFCDRCNEEVLHKTLSAECAKNGRVKTQQDLAVMRKRSHNSYRSKWQLKWEEGKLKENKKGGN